MSKNLDVNGNAVVTYGRIYGLLGLAARKGSVVSGAVACEQALKGAADGLLIIANDASRNTYEKFSGAAAVSGIECKLFGSCDELGKRTGKDRRAVLLVTDGGLAGAISALIT